ncbi:C-type lectin domain family 2 member D-like isoform 3-T3 [Pangshura tecta]
MREGAEADPSEQPLNSSIDLKGSGEPGHPDNSSSRKPAVWDRPAALRAIIVVTTVVIIALLAALIGVTSKQPPPCPPAASWCLDGWIWIQVKCYYFSKGEGNWTYSQSFCSSHAASLAGIESPQELAFMLRYKGKPEHWIGLRREQDLGQPWKWVNGSEFNRWFRIRGGGDCAYLNDEKGVSSSRCIMTRYWICSKPDA